MPKGTRTGTELVLQMTMIEILKRGPGNGVRLNLIETSWRGLKGEMFDNWLFNSDSLTVELIDKNGITTTKCSYTHVTCDAYEVAKKILMNSDGSQKE